ncbi:MAG: SRPBCC family protein [Pseudomonadota bacterium]
MKFEHLIEINDAFNPLYDVLTREQVWQGLVLRAEAPKLFVPHLDECELYDRSEDAVSRRLRYGELVIVDRVTFTPQQQVLYAVAAQKDIAESSLRMLIEEPQPGSLFVRFQYDDGNDEATDAVNAMYNDFRRSAYVESDIDTIRLLRQIAQAGSLGSIH